jgi:type IV pilus assembly protein PilM
MLSFDITDRNIRVVKGAEANNKIKISSAATVNVEEGLIVNGHVRDVPSVANLINNVRKMNRMPDREAIVSISSNLTIFKEMIVPKAKGQDLQKIVRLQMQQELNLDDSYSVSYIVVGDAGSEASEPSYKILATACPYEIVNSYREVFKLLDVNLKSVMIGCNCITKVLLADAKIKSKMPLLAVQIDNNFISLNLYEQGQLSFSRFASIDPADYGYSDDYVFEAVNENIFRMLQFHRSRNTGETIENVVFYGDTHEYVRLTDELEKLDLKTSLINVPPQIHGHENLEFSLYANAIGAMFKRNKEIEKINLLETDLGTTLKNKVKDDNAGNAILVLCLLGSLIVGGGTWAIQSMRNASIENDIEIVETYINSTDTQNKLRQHERLLELRSEVQAYRDRMNNTKDAYLSQPVIDGDKFDKVDELLKQVAEENEIENFEIIKPQYSDGTLSFLVQCDAKDEQYAQKLPAEFVNRILKEGSDMFGAAGYSGYVVKDYTNKGNTDNNEVVKKAEFNVSAELKSKESAYHPEENEKSNEEAAE